MVSIPINELAGLGAAILWAGSALCWASLGRRMSPTVVATVRLLVAIAALALLHRMLFGRFWPASLPRGTFWTLCLSGIIGAGAGDVLYMHSLSMIGPRLCMTLASLAPVFSALLVLPPPMSERLTGLEIAGMVMAVGGVVWVVAEPRGREAWPATPARFRRGVLLAVLSAVCLSLGFITSRAGMTHFTPEPVPAFSATLVRVTAAGVFCCAVLLFQRRSREMIDSMRQRRDVGILLTGVALGPVVGIWLSMVALQGRATGVASTLICLSPLVLIPLSWIAYGERPTRGRVVATAVALIGVALLMLQPHGG